MLRSEKYILLTKLVGRLESLDRRRWKGSLLEDFTTTLGTYTVDLYWNPAEQFTGRPQNVLGISKDGIMIATFRRLGIVDDLHTDLYNKDHELKLSARELSDLRRLEDYLDLP